MPKICITGLIFGLIFVTGKDDIMYFRFSKKDNDLYRLLERNTLRDLILCRTSADTKKDTERPAEEAEGSDAEKAEAVEPSAPNKKRNRDRKQ